MAGERQGRLSDRIRVILAERLAKGLRDPRLGYVTITDVRVTGDLQHASVFYTVLGTDEEREGSAAALKAATGMLEPEIRQEVVGHAEVRKVFKVSKVGTVAGCYVTDGMVQREALIRVTRQGIVIENDRVLEQLKRFKDDAREVRAGMECGMKIVGYDDIKEGDILECYKKVEVKRTL